MTGYLHTRKKAECFGCEACASACAQHAITMTEDAEGFRYPVIDDSICTHCAQCHNSCPIEHMPPFQAEEKNVFGGYVKDPAIRQTSTSGGAFTAIVNVWADENYVIFGASSKGLLVYHSSVSDKRDIGSFRKSKYSQSIIGSAYFDTKKHLAEGKRVLFSGTPCQIAGLYSFLGHTQYENLLTVEVVCEGVPTPLFMRSLQKHLGGKILTLDYRNKDSSKWDFQVMKIGLDNREWKRDRWFNPFWSIWLQHLMSRPSCYECPFARPDRIADITLGDLWGVHLYCPELYGHNGGSSLIVANTNKGKAILKSASTALIGHSLEFKTALRYQSPMRKHISYNPKRSEFMQDILTIPYAQLCSKWSKRPTLKLLFEKYIWGNRQKVLIWSFLHKDLHTHLQKN